MIRVKPVLLGAVTFLAVHALLAAKWQTWFHGGDGYPPWFMNSGTTVALTAATFAVVNLVVAVCARVPRVDDALITSGNIAAGAAVPMIVVLFRTPGGPGNLFPIAIAIGVGIFAVSGAAGAFVGWTLRKARHS